MDSAAPVQPLPFRLATVARILKTDPDLRINLAKKSTEFLDVAAAVFVRTLAKSCSVNHARSGKRGKIDNEVFQNVIGTYLQLEFLEGCIDDETSNANQQQQQPTLNSFMHRE
jgi:hypothetical protein